MVKRCLSLIICNLLQVVVRNPDLTPRKNSTSKSQNQYEGKDLELNFSNRAELYFGFQTQNNPPTNYSVQHKVLKQSQ